MGAIEAVALHHEPSRSRVSRFTPLTAVHAAAALIHQENPEAAGGEPIQLDEAYLAQLGLLGCLPQWKETVRAEREG